MSTLPPKADMFSVEIDVCFVPKGDLLTRGRGRGKEAAEVMNRQRKGFHHLLNWRNLCRPSRVRLDDQT
jgi:hypothetical protein